MMSQVPTAMTDASHGTSLCVRRPLTDQTISADRRHALQANDYQYLYCSRVVTARTHHASPTSLGGLVRHAPPPPRKAGYPRTRARQARSVLAGKGRHVTGRLGKAEQSRALGQGVAIFGSPLVHWGSAGVYSLGYFPVLWDVSLSPIASHSALFDP